MIRCCRHVLMLAAALPSVALAQRPVATAFELVDVAADAGLDFVSVSGDGAMDYIVEANGNGAAVFDYDTDGDLDILLVSGSTLARFEQDGGQQMTVLFRNDGGLRFREVTEAAGLGQRGWGMGSCIADYDRDGDLDAYVTAFGPNRLYRNSGDGTFVEVAAEEGVADPRWSHSCAFGDYDGDGDADLYVTNYVVFDRDVVPARGNGSPCNYRGFKTFCGPLGMTAEADGLYLNQAPTGFEPLASDQPPRFALGVAFCDLDESGRADFFVTNDSQHNYLLRTGPEGGLQDQALLSGVAVNELGMPQASMGIAVGDYDNDLDLDLFVTNFSEDYNTLYRNQGRGLFVDYSVAAGVAQSSMEELGWGTLFVDFDNDGWLDLFIANGHVYENAADFGLGSTFLQANRLFINSRDGRFRDATRQIVPAAEGPRSSRGLATGDLDGDGDLDLVVVNINSPPSLLANRLTGEQRWLRVAFTSGPALPDPIGTRLILTAESEQRIGELVGGGSYLTQSEPVVHFGLGSVRRIDRLEVRRPSGKKRVYLGLRSAATYHLR